MTQRSVEIETADGTCPAALSIPDGAGPWPAIVMFPDAGGMRDTMREMGGRLSALGYVVLVPDVYYRNGPYDPIDMRTAFSTKESAEKVMAMIGGYTVDKAARDAGAFADFLDTLPEKQAGGIGTTGTATHLAEHSRHQNALRAIEHRLNTMPRRSLHWSTSHDVYTAAVAMTG